MYSPRAYQPSDGFDVSSGRGGPQQPYSARPQSALSLSSRDSIRRDPQPGSLLSPRGSTPRGATPRGATPRNLVNPRTSPRSLNEVSAGLAEWALRQSQIREMLGPSQLSLGKSQKPYLDKAARERALEQERKAHLLLHRTQQRFVERPSTASPRLVPAPGKQLDLPHLRVWRELNERKERNNARMWEREAQAMAREQAEAEAAVARALEPAPQRMFTPEMMAQMTNTQRKLRSWFEDDFKRFRKVFRAMDDDHNGWCDRNELLTLPHRTNLHYLLPRPVLEALIDLMDIDGDGRILYKEFVKVIMAEDLFNL